MTRPFLLFALTTVILLASGCPRSQAVPPVSTPRTSVTAQESGQEFSPSPADELDNPVDPLHPGEAADIGLVQATATPENSFIVTPQTNTGPIRQLSTLSDLLYIAQDSLMRWDPLTGKAVPLAQNVIDYSPSPDGQVIVLLRPQKITANGVQHFDLDALHLKDQQIITLADNAASIQQIAVSPDGSHVVFTQKDAQGVTIFVSPTTPGNQPQILGTCHAEPVAECASLAWSPDSRDLVWSDALGLWQAPAKAGVNLQRAKLVHSNRVQIKDPKGQSLEIKARFTDLEFAPSERFVLVKVALIGSQVGWQAVFDRRSGLLSQATDTYITGEVETLVKWQANGNLLVGHASEPNRYVPPFIHIWHVIPTNPDILVSGEQYNLYSDDFPFSTAQSKSIPAHRLIWLTEAQPNHLLFAIRLNRSDDPPVLFDLNILNGSLTKLEILPAETSQVLWSPDGINALVLGGRNQIYLLSMRTSEFTDLQPTIGPGAHHFFWLTPTFRK
ncbi:MAG: hypothetical protein A2W35_17475 [Chloroflexi bacterium RBG_16_57_11]|nr:MAG: hypothetical protein A2W35_17475 [Chloroflexi bacterium RBG_16_57_11]